MNTLTPASQSGCWPPLTMVGRYILTPRVFKLLDSLEPGSGGEIQLTDAISHMIKEQTVLAFEFDGQRFDCGSKLGYLQANVELGLKHPDLADEFRSYLSNLTQDWPR